MAYELHGPVERTHRPNYPLERSQSTKVLQLAATHRVNDVCHFHPVNTHRSSSSLPTASPLSTSATTRAYPVLVPIASQFPPAPVSIGILPINDVRFGNCLPSSSPSGHCPLETVLMLRSGWNPRSAPHLQPSAAPQRHFHHPDRSAPPLRLPQPTRPSFGSIRRPDIPARHFRQNLQRHGRSGRFPPTWNCTPDPGTEGTKSTRLRPTKMLPGSVRLGITAGGNDIFGRTARDLVAADVPLWRVRMDDVLQKMPLLGDLFCHRAALNEVRTPGYKRGEEADSQARTLCTEWPGLDREERCKRIAFQFWLLVLVSV